MLFGMWTFRQGCSAIEADAAFNPQDFPPCTLLQWALSTFVGRQGAGLWGRLSTSFGYLSKQGYCTGSNALGSPSGACHLFPTMLGETGSGMTARPFSLLHVIVGGLVGLVGLDMGVDGYSNRREVFGQGHCTLPCRQRDRPWCAIHGRYLRCCQEGAVSPHGACLLPGPRGHEPDDGLGALGAQHRAGRRRAAHAAVGPVLVGVEQQLGCGNGPCTVLCSIIACSFSVSLGIASKNT